MATTNPQPVPTQSEQLKKKQEEQLDLALSVILFSWPALTLAVQSNWGGPTSSDKREYLCGAISDLFVSRPETDTEDLEEVLIQYMNDEFDVVVDDGSCAEVAGQIAAVRAEVGRGEFGSVKGLWENYQAKMAKGGGKEVVGAGFKRVEAGDEDQETDEEDWEDDDEDEDVDMMDAPAAAPRAPREKVEPEVDEDGFTKVPERRKR